MISCVQFIPLTTFWKSDQSQHPFLNSGRFSFWNQTLWCWNEYSSCRIDWHSGKPLRTLRHLGRTQTTLTEAVVSSWASHIHASAPQQPNIPSQTDTHTGQGKSQWFWSWLLCLSSTLRSQFHRNIFSGALSPFKLPHVNSAHCCRVAPAGKAEVCTAEHPDTADAPLGSAMV